MNYKAVIFDMDGTLVHTSPEYRYQIVGRVLEDLNGKHSKEGIDRFWFESRRDEIIQEYFGLEPSLFWETYRRYDSMELREKFAKPYDDIDFIQELKKAGIKRGIVTGAPVHIASVQISMIGEEYFGGIVVAQSSNGIKPKPHPHGLEECLKILEVKNTEAMYVGNADEDVMTAQNAQVTSVLILRGEHPVVGVSPDIIINSLYDLREILGI
jgi:phosphoglycolate phosphatase-like HAD superfamily hydrolase